MRAGFFIIGAFVALLAGRAWAEDEPSPSLFDQGRLLATGGATEIEGAGGGGIAAWSLITGYGTDRGVGANLHGTYVYLPDFALYAGGASIGLFDRLELSYQRLAFDTRATGAALGIGSGYTFHVDVAGAKLRLFGNAIYDQDSMLPQVAIGVQYKVNDRAELLRAIGARSAAGVDFYLAATRVFLNQSLLLNAAIRMTRANQLGILGFGGDRDDRYRPQFEGSAAYLFSRQIAAGVEYRTKPDNLSFAHESNWFDAFATVFINKSVSATLAYVNAGSVATRSNQNGGYMSLQLGF